MYTKTNYHNTKYDNKLIELFQQRNFYTDKIGYQGNPNVGMNFGYAFAELLRKYENKEINLLEIGVNQGGAISCYLDYFSKGTMFGIDIANRIEYNLHPELNSKRFNFYLGSFDNLEIIENISQNKFDIIIEDGSHELDHQKRSIEIYLPFLKKDGIMIIEDIANPDQDYEYLSQFVDLNKYTFEYVDLRALNNQFDDFLIIIKHR